MKEKIRNILCSLPVLLVLPYLMVIIVNGAEQALTVHTFDPEEWIAAACWKDRYLQDMRRKQ